MKISRKSSTEKVNGHVKQDGANYYFQPLNGQKVVGQIGYVKYGTKADTNVDVGFADYYPVTDFLLAKLCEEQSICVLEYKNNAMYFINDKLVLII